MSTSRLLLTSMLVSSTLIMGACNNKDKGANEKITSSAGELVSSDAVSNKDFDALLKVKSRKTTATEADTALKKMGLDESNSGTLKWADASGKDGDYTYTNLTTTGDDGEDIKIGELKLTGVHMDGENPAFDRIDMKNIIAIDGTNTASIASLTASHPSPQVAAAIIGAVQDMTNIDGIDDVIEEGGMPFGALLLSELNIKSEDSNIALASLGWGEDTDTNKGLFMLEDLKMNVQDRGGDSPVTVSLGSISAKGIDMDYARTVGATAMVNGMKPPSANGLNFNPFSKTFESFSLKDLAVNVDTMSLTSDGIVGVAKEKKGVTTIQQSIKPFTLSFSGEAQDRNIAQMQQTLLSAGFEKVVLSAGSTTTLNEKADSFDVSDAFMKVDDAFVMDFAYGGSGLKAMGETMNAANESGASSSEGMDAMLEQVSLGHFDFALTDNSIIEKAMSIAAQQQGSTPALIKMQAKSGLMMMGLAAQTESQGEALSSLSSALGHFIDDGGTLKISLRPEAPLTGSDLKNMKPETIDPKVLGFSVEHQK